MRKLASKIMGVIASLSHCGAFHSGQDGAWLQATISQANAMTVSREYPAEYGLSPSQLTSSVRRRVLAIRKWLSGRNNDASTRFVILALAFR